MKKFVSGSGMNNSDHFSEILETIFLVKILKLSDADPGSGMSNSDPGSGINIPDPQQWIFAFLCLFEWQVSLFWKNIHCDRPKGTVPHRFEYMLTHTGE
jgi:hypothetical protein